jgi:hypothetical protein
VQSVGNRLGITSELLQFFWRRRWWWLSPIIGMVLLLAGLAIFVPSPAPPTVDLYIIFSGEIEKFCMLV